MTNQAHADRAISKRPRLLVVGRRWLVGISCAALCGAGFHPALANAAGEGAPTIAAPHGAAADRQAKASHPAPPYWAPLPKPPAGAPNILLVMTDDVGFGAASTFGGPIPTPNLDRLAAHGLRYTAFNTTAMCSPSRAALLTGRNPHAVGFGAIADMAMGYPAYNTEIPDDSRTIAEVLRRSGYATSMFGKTHLISYWDRALTGPHKQWPTSQGFDYFYGFTAADSDQFNPTLVRGTNLVPADTNAERLLDASMADDAIQWIHQAKADDPDRPFFTYFSPGSAHAPQQAPKAWIARFHGKFDDGWDRMRAETVARQKAMGLIPSNARVSPRPKELRAWSDVPESDRRVFARYMEVFAAQLAYQDAQIGRIIDELKRMGEFDNTLILFIQGDNGSSAEGGHEGSTSEMRKLGQLSANFSPEELADLDRLGGPETFQVYQAEWGWALDAPFPNFKVHASHLGGVRNGLVVSWPKGVRDPGRVVTRFQHITDIAPTLLAASGVERPPVIDGIEQAPLTGVSLADSFSGKVDADAPRTQYFEMMGNRALFKDGWWASTVPGRMPWEARSRVPVEEFKWQLFNLREDPLQAVDLSARYPAKLEEMIALWNAEAEKYNVRPMRADLDVNELIRTSRPLPKRDRFVFWGGDVHLPWTRQPDLQKGSFSIEATIETARATEGQGVILATGSLLAGWSLRLEDGAPVLYHAATEAKADQFRVAAPAPVADGKRTIRILFKADDDKPGSGGMVRIFVDGEQVAEQHIARRATRMASSNEMFDIGMDTGVPVVVGQKGMLPFTGRIEKVVVERGE